MYAVGIYSIFLLFASAALGNPIQNQDEADALNSTAVGSLVWRTSTSYPRDNITLFPWDRWTPFPWDRFTLPEFKYTLPPSVYEENNYTPFRIGVYFIAIIIGVLVGLCKLLCKKLGDSSNTSSSTQIAGESSSRTASEPRLLNNPVVPSRHPNNTSSMSSRNDGSAPRNHTVTSRNESLVSQSSSSTIVQSVTDTGHRRYTLTTERRADSRNNRIPVQSKRPIANSDKPPDYSTVVLGYMAEEKFPEVHTKTTVDTPPPKYDDSLAKY